VNDSNFQIEQQCPQCGAPIILDETDRILTCGFCRIRVYLATEDHFRFYFPPKEGIAEPLYFLPFWRIKGLSYTIGESEILSKYFDTNFLAMDTDLLPHSLGLRPQAMKLFFVGSGDVSGRFIASSGETGENLLKKYRNRSPGKYDREIFIGERKSVIYAPVYFADSHVYDAILKNLCWIHRQTPLLSRCSKIVPLKNGMWNLFLCFARNAERICREKKMP